MKDVEHILLTRAEISALKAILDSVENPDAQLFCEKIKKMLKTTDNNVGDDNIVSFADFKNSEITNIVNLSSYRNRKKL